MHSVTWQHCCAEAQAFLEGRLLHAAGLSTAWDLPEHAANKFAACVLSSVCLCHAVAIVSCAHMSHLQGRARASFNETGSLSPVQPLRKVCVRQLPVAGYDNGIEHSSLIMSMSMVCGQYMKGLHAAGSTRHVAGLAC